MRKLIFILLIIPFSVYSVSKPETKKHRVSAGIGFPNLPRFVFNTFDYKDKFSSKGAGPFHLKYENRLNPWIGLGLSINYMQFKITYADIFADTFGGINPNNVSIKSSNIAFNARLNFHFLNPEKHEKTEFYLGIGIGAKFGRIRITSDFSEGLPKYTLPWYFTSFSNLGLESTLGFRYFPHENIGFYTELGFAKSLIQLGVSGRF